VCTAGFGNVVPHQAPAWKVCIFVSEVCGKWKTSLWLFSFRSAVCMSVVVVGSVHMLTTKQNCLVLKHIILECPWIPLL
jgi:hypothetical protein